MPATTLPKPDDHSHGMNFAEFVVMMASLTAVHALGIDMMLPALGAIGRELGVAIENHQQLVIAVYVGSYGLGQLFWGPLTDRFGRRAILLGAMTIYAAMSFVAAHVGSFEMLLASRAVQGLSAASTRVLTTSIIRDCYGGRRMAKVMSLSFMIFMAVPILAPTFGQLILLVAPWHWIFYVLGSFSLGVAVWAGLRLPETLDPENRRAISIGSVAGAAREVLGNRYSIGYTLCVSALYGAMLGYLQSFAQILEHRFHRPDLFGLSFAASTAFLAVAALLNSRIVERFGMRMISHAALLCLIAICTVRLSIVLAGQETLLLFTLLSGVSFFLYALTGPNFGAMAMEPMAHIAGTAASIQGFLSTLIASLFSIVIGQSFDGGTLPLTLGWLIAGVVTLGLVLMIEGGRLFRPHDPRSQPTS